MSTALSITEQEFEQVVLQDEGLVMVDFWAPWCGPCRVISPLLEQLAGEYAGKAAIVKVNVDENIERASQYNVRGLPTLVFFRNGKEVDRVIGAGSKTAYQQKLEALLAQS